MVLRVRHVRNGTKQRQEQHDHPCGGWHIAFKPMPTAVTTCNKTDYICSRESQPTPSYTKCSRDPVAGRNPANLWDEPPTSTGERRISEPSAVSLHLFVSFSPQKEACPRLLVRLNFHKDHPQFEGVEEHGNHPKTCMRVAS